MQSIEERTELGKHLSTCLAHAGATGIEPASLPTADVLDALDHAGLTSAQQSCFARYADYFAVPRS